MSGVIRIAQPQNIGHFFYEIISKYLNLTEMEEKVKQEFLITISAFLRRIVYDKRCLPESKPDKPVKTDLSNFPAVANILESIVCKSMNKT
jgi:hypothetical protein